MKTVFAMARSGLMCGLFLTVGLIAAATPAQAQLTGIVNYALPVGGDPATHLVAEYGRGLNEDSGKMNAFALAVGRSGIGGRGTGVIGASMLDAEPDAEYSFGGAFAVGVTRPEQPTQISVQAGIGYLSTELSPAVDATFWSIPIGIALQRAVEQGSGTLDYWVMPRVHLSRMSADNIDSEMETDFGASGGLGFTTASGLGFHAAIDLLAQDPSIWTLGAGIHYVIP